jgi:hypothetical protein
LACPPPLMAAIFWFKVSIRYRISSYIMSELSHPAYIVIVDLGQSSL